MTKLDDELNYRCEGTHPSDNEAEDQMQSAFVVMIAIVAACVIGVCYIAFTFVRHLYHYFAR